MDLRLNNLLTRMLSPRPARASLDLHARSVRFPRPSSNRWSGVRKVSPAPKCSTSTSASSTAASNVIAKDGKEVLEKGKGWTDARGVQDERILHRFHQLTTTVSDRVEMHKILAEQRDNWNLLFHSTITIASVYAASVLAMSSASQEQAPGLCVVATILNVASAALMALVNMEQPSQLAEEQRRAARFFRRLRVEVEATLKIDPQLREDASAFWEEKVGTLHALDEAFPLPLTPSGLEKFPKHVRPAELSPDPHGSEEGKLQRDDNQQLSSLVRSRRSSCQWTPLTETFVKRISARVIDEEVRELIEVAERAKLLNLWLGRVSPVLAGGSAVINVLVSVGLLALDDRVSWVAAAMTVVAFVLHSFCHALQLGGLFEVYRSSAGYYADIHNSVERELELPRRRREDFKLFLLKLQLKLGRRPGEQVASGDAERFL